MIFLNFCLLQEHLKIKLCRGYEIFKRFLQIFLSFLKFVRYTQVTKQGSWLARILELMEQLLDSFKLIFIKL